MTDHNPERKSSKNITFSISEKTAHNLELEAQLEGISIAELLRRATATYILSKSVIREIRAQYPEEADISVQESYLALNEDQNTLAFYGLRLNESQRLQLELIYKFDMY